jgi:tetratricopeptide (TPR) repeat protein
MPTIREQTQQNLSVTHESRALQHFTNRKGSIRRFAEYLHGQPREQILFFHGDGGNGKSLLLRHLRLRCAKQLDADGWDYVQALQPDEFRQQFEATENARPVPTAALDFADRHYREAFAALTNLRRQLAGRGLRFAVFDYACLLLLRHRNELTPERIKNMFPAEETDFIKESIDVLSHAPVPGLGLAKAVLGVINKRLGERFTLYWQRRGIDETELERLRKLDPERELYQELPTLLARDLNASMALLAQQPNAPSRVVLFFDTHEAFWEVEERRRAGDKRYENDRWLRQLLLDLDFARGIVAVVAGRETPAWAEASEDKISAEFVDEYLVGCLERADAASYLHSLTIDEEKLQAALLNYAEQEPGKVHPYYLGLCADVVLAARARGELLTADEFADTPALADKGTALLARLQRYVTDGIRDAIAPLCACRSFDFTLFEYLMREFNLNATRTDFNHLVEFSFVWQAETAGRYRLHDLMRRLAFERDDAQTRRAHELLRAHYDERAQTGDASALAARAYHRNRLEPQAGIDEWVTALDEALTLSRYETCRALLTVRDELIVPADFAYGRLSQSAGEFYAALSQHEPARQQFANAIAAYDEALRRAPDDVFAHNNRGNALWSLGELQAGLSAHAEAQGSYAAAVSAYDEALRRAPDDVAAHNNRGKALLSWARLLETLGDQAAAMSKAQVAAQSLAHSLRVAPNQRGIRARYEQLQALLSAAETQESAHNQ